MIQFNLEGKDEGLNVVRLQSGERRRLTDEQLGILQAGGELPETDPVPAVADGPNLHPFSDTQTGAVAPGTGEDAVKVGELHTDGSQQTATLGNPGDPPAKPAESTEGQEAK